MHKKLSAYRSFLHWATGFCLSTDSAPTPPHPNTADTYLVVTKSSEVKNCCYPSSPADELRMERI